jgi:hypothetical protein
MSSDALDYSLDSDDVYYGVSFEHYTRVPAYINNVKKHSTVEVKRLKGRLFTGITAQVYITFQK